MGDRDMQQKPKNFWPCLQSSRDFTVQGVVWHRFSFFVIYSAVTSHPESWNDQRNWMTHIMRHNFFMLPFH